MCSAAITSSSIRPSRTSCRKPARPATGTAAGANTWVTPSSRSSRPLDWTRATMIDLHQLLQASGRAVVFIPAVLVAALGLPTLVGRSLPERMITRLVNLAMVLGLVASSLVLIAMLATGERNVHIDLGNWVAIGQHAAESPGGSPDQEAFHFAFKFKFDRLSVPFAILTFLLCGVISTFASRYLHRESGFNRFFLLLALFVVGMVLTTLAGTIETLFTGWEFVGISSALLVAF